MQRLLLVASGEKARQTHKMPRLISQLKKNVIFGSRSISCVRRVLSFIPEAVNTILNDHRLAPVVVIIKARNYCSAT
jgi:hypothetical protein